MQQALDGTCIAFPSNRDGDFEVWVMNADGTNPIDLTRNTPDAALTTSKASPSPQST